MSNRLRELSEEVKALEARVREAGGAKRLEKLHQQGKLSARERVELLRDKWSSMLEIGLLVAYDQYDGQAPAAGVVTAITRVHGRETVVV
ncbi:MAG: propionyl-CoA carboxylase, partial [Gemmatimonadetes bacterium]